MRAMFHPIHVCTHGDLCVYVCDQDCRVRAMLYPFHASTSGDLSLSLCERSVRVVFYTIHPCTPWYLFLCLRARTRVRVSCLLVLIDI